jgi:RNA polymerase-binding transcription factor DksA
MTSGRKKSRINKKLFEEIEKELEKRKSSLEEILAGFAQKNKNSADNWDANFPNFANESLEDAADEVEEYEARLPLEKGLEKQLKEINFALEKIKNNAYGWCEKCSKAIGEEMLSLFPETRICANCKNKSKKTGK